MKVALTGGIATGKSFCLSHFKSLGAQTIDADTLSREVVALGSPTLDAIVRRFGPSVLKPDGTLNRQALGRIAFGDTSARKDLEAITHPAVYARLRAWFEEVDRVANRDALGTTPRISIAEIPLLYETGREREFDAVVVAACDHGQQMARLALRDGTPSLDARQRIGSQWSLDEKRKRADYVIDTSGKETDTEKEVERVWKALARAWATASGD